LADSPTQDRSSYLLAGTTRANRLRCGSRIIFLVTARYMLFMIATGLAIWLGGLAASDTSMDGVVIFSMRSVQATSFADLALAFLYIAFAAMTYMLVAAIVAHVAGSTTGLAVSLMTFTAAEIGLLLESTRAIAIDFLPSGLAARWWRILNSAEGVGATAAGGIAMWICALLTGLLILLATRPRWVRRIV